MKPIKVPPRLWYGLCTLWCAFIGEANAINFLRRLADLPHNHLTGALAATLDLAFTVLMVISVRDCLHNFLHPPP